MLVANVLWFAACASASRIVHRQDGGFSLPVEPTVIEDVPTSSNTIDYSAFHPSSAEENTDADTSSDPTFFVQTTFPPITGTDLITITGTNTRSVSDDDEDESSSSSSSATVSDASTSTTATTSETASADDAETTTESDDAAPTVGPGPAAAGVAALLGLAVVI